MSTHTPRQMRAFEALKAARERIAIIKAVPCHTAAEDSKARWERLKDAERKFKEAFNELDASIVDEMGDTEWPT